MATSIIKGTRQETVQITTGTTQYQGFYYGANGDYTSYNVERADIISVSNNSVALVNVLGWTTRVYTPTASQTVTVKFTMK